MFPETTNLQPASLSFAISIKPESRVRLLAEAASAAITNRFDNQNQVLEHRFPAHISLLLAGTDRTHAHNLIGQLQDATDEPDVRPLLHSPLRATRLYRERGFIGLECERTVELEALTQRVFDVYATFHAQHRCFRPHLIERWPRLDEERQEQLWELGTYKLPARHRFHISIASVLPENGVEALELAGMHLQVPFTFHATALELVDIGHQNEQWIPLAQLAV